MEEKQRFELEEFVLELEEYKGRHTELVTVYVPAGYSLINIAKQLEQEKSTATNIKSKVTRKNVLDALERLIRHIKLIKKTPENGIALFSGNISETEGQPQIEVFSIEPPMPLKSRLYRCDQQFVLDPLREMLEVSEVYGLVVIDRNEATIGLLEGKQIKTLQHMTSGVPGKTEKGGQCLSSDTFIMKDNGELMEIKDAHNPLFVISENFNSEQTESTPLITRWENNKQLFKIITKYPRLEIKASENHMFFVRTEKGIEEKPLSEIREGEFLIMPEKINVKGEIQKIDSNKYYSSVIISQEGRKLLESRRKEKKLLQKELAKKVGLTQTAISTFELGKRNISKKNLRKLCCFLDIEFEDFLERFTTKSKEINLPMFLNEDFAQFLGYFMGDGSIESNRITFFEQRKELAEYYKKKFDSLFSISSSYRFRKSKNYHQIRIHSKELADLIRGEFPKIIGTLNSSISSKILKSSNNILALFIKGLFDAEGYVSSNRVALGINNKRIIRQLQLCLLRLGIVSSILEYDNKRNPYSDKIRYTLTIDDTEGVRKFEKFIGFSSIEKKEKLRGMVLKRKCRSNVRQLVVSGMEIARIIKNSGLNISKFHCSMFFSNKRQMSKEIFKKKILDKVKSSDLRKRLDFIYNSNLILVKVKKIEPLEIEKTIDIETKNHNFVANGLIVHNSAARFARIRDNMAKEFFRRVAEAVKNNFFDMKKLKGIIVGGPGPTKEDFLKEGQLVTALKDKVLGVKDIGYADEYGMELLVEASRDLLAEQEITREKELLEDFFTKLAKQPEKVAYGLEAVQKALEVGAVNLLILNKKLGKRQIKQLADKAENIAAKTELVSEETEEGQQFKSLGGVGAILRFAI